MPVVGEQVETERQKHRPSTVTLTAHVRRGLMSLPLVSITAATEKDTVCVLTCTLVVARWMSAPAWTSRSTTLVWPFQLATYTGL